MRNYQKALAFYLQNPASLFKQIRMTQNKQVVDEPFIFVLGPPRSGTTMIHRLLLNHSAIIGFEEETAVFSSRSVEDYRRFSHFVSKDVYRDALKRSASLAEFCVELHTGGLPRSNGEFFVEKTPQHAIWMNYISARLPNAKFIFCIRDPRDTYCSARSSGVIPQSVNLKRHAHYFKKCVANMVDADSTIKERSFIIPYEAFVARPEYMLNRMSCFLGLAPEAGQQLQKLRYTQDARAGRPEFARLSHEINKKTVARWTREITLAEARAYSGIIEREMRFFGYEIDSPKGLSS